MKFITFPVFLAIFITIFGSSLAATTVLMTNGEHQVSAHHRVKAVTPSPSMEMCQSISDSSECITMGCCLIQYMRPAGYTRRLMTVTECTAPLQEGDSCLRFNEETRHYQKMLMRMAGPQRQLAAMMCRCQSGYECPVASGDFASTCQVSTAKTQQVTLRPSVQPVKYIIQRRVKN